MNLLFIAFAFFMLLTFGYRTLNSRAAKHLTEDKKATLESLFSPNRNLYHTAILIVFALLYFFALQYQVMPFPLALGAYVVLVSIFIGITIYLSYQKLVDHDFTQTYIRLFILSSIIYMVGLMIFFGVIYSASLYQHLIGA